MYLLDVGTCLYDIEEKEVVYDVNPLDLKNVSDSFSNVQLLSYFSEFLVSMLTTLTIEDVTANKKDIEVLYTQLAVVVGILTVITDLK